jgi:hypothetical protein
VRDTYYEVDNERVLIAVGYNLDTPWIKDGQSFTITLYTPIPEGKTSGDSIMNCIEPDYSHSTQILTATNTLSVCSNGAINPPTCTQFEICRNTTSRATCETTPVSIGNHIVAACNIGACIAGT